MRQPCPLAQVCPAQRLPEVGVGVVAELRCIHWRELTECLAAAQISNGRIAPGSRGSTPPCDAPSRSARTPVAGAYRRDVDTPCASAVCSTCRPTGLAADAAARALATLAASHVQHSGRQQ